MIAQAVLQEFWVMDGIEIDSNYEIKSGLEDLYPVFIRQDSFHFSVHGCSVNAMGTQFPSPPF